LNGTYIDHLALKYRGRGALPDANLLLLYFMGTYDAEQIQRFKRTEKYFPDDFYVLERMVNFFAKIVTSPNILTEVSNLSNQLAEPARTQYFSEFARRIHALEEQYCPSSQACGHPYFTKCGLTDAVIIELSLNAYLVITDDFRLSNLLQAIGIDVINFNHIRFWDLLSR
jgi:rRNA-processing protein FCF1